MENYWYYHKWATIIALVVIFCLVASLPGLISKKEDDLSVLLLGKQMMLRDLEPGVQDQAVEGIIKDATGDSETHISCRLLGFTGNDAEDYYIYQAVSVELAAGDSRLYIMEKEFFSFFDGQEVLLPLTGESEDALYDAAGDPVALPVTNTALAERMGILLPEDAYVGVRAITQSEQKQKNIGAVQENALALFRELTKETTT